MYINIWGINVYNYYTFFLGDSLNQHDSFNQYDFLCLLNNFGLKPTLFGMSIATPAYFWSPFP